MPDYDKKVTCDTCGCKLDKADAVEFTATGRFLCERCFDERPRGEA